MKNKGAFYTLLLIMAVGITITTCTNYFLRGSLNTGTTAKTAYEQAADPKAAPLKEDGGAASGGMSGMAETEKQTEKAGGRMARGLGADDKAEKEADWQEEESFDAGATKDSAIAGAPAAGSGQEGAAVAFSLEEDTPVAAYSPPEEDAEGAPGAEAGAEAYDPPEEMLSGDSQEKKLQDSEVIVEAVRISPLETASSQGASQKEGTVKSSYYRNRLSELDAQIQKNRDSQTSNSANAGSVSQSLAAGELKLWDNELNLIYDEILDRLDEKQAGELVEEERQWMKERDRLAAEAARASSGDAQESAEYTASLAESTRLRAYELLNGYEYLLVD